MSRSIHKTVRGVFRGKSKATVDEMFAENDPDIEDLMKKRTYKREEILRRKECRQPQFSEGTE